MSGLADPRALARALESWHRRSHRELPWRPDPIDTPRDPYLCLVSELMLQQTQVARVLEKFDAFVRTFPDVGALAAAAQDDVLALWSGLGYYRRARLLHAAAKTVVQEHGGVFPRSAAGLRGLPGVGRYTAGSIASMAFGERAPIVDGNVARVVLRVRGEARPVDARATQALLWDDAQRLVESADVPGVLNESLMELGATVCTPRGPSCGACPVRRWCVAGRSGTAEAIPAAKARGPRTVLYVAAAVVRDARGRVLLEQRPARGLWGGLWQVPSVESGAAMPGLEELARHAGVGGLADAGAFEFATTHRAVRAGVYVAQQAGLGAEEGGGTRRWVEASGLDGLGMGNFQRRVLALAGVGETRPNTKRRSKEVAVKGRVVSRSAGENAAGARGG